MESSSSPQLELVTPYIALMMGRDENDQYLFASQFLASSEAEQEILVGEGTLAIIKGWITSGLLPQTHALAISKLIGMLALEDEISTSALPGILEKIGIPQPGATQLTDQIVRLVQPFIDQRISDSEPEPLLSALPIPPLPPSSPVPSRNTIDLRNKPTV